jgi:Lipid-droplet associated hydrolase
LRAAHTLPGIHLSTTLAKFLNPASVESFAHLAHYEFRDIRGLDRDTLGKYAKRVTAYYAVHDRWVPGFGREEVMRILMENGGDAQLCNEGFPHSFSLGSGPFLRGVNEAVHGPQMAKKIALWISAVHHPVSRSPLLSRKDDISEMDDEQSEYSSTFPWTWSEQDAETLVNTSPDLGRSPARKESLGGGVIARQTLIKDLE